MNIQIGQFQAGVADDWCIISALTVHEPGQPEAWVLITATYLKMGSKGEQPAVFRLDVEPDVTEIVLMN